ncbi:MAG: nickel-responsive transcriptional regulator NikR [Polyangiaceae bacterium]
MSPKDSLVRFGVAMESGLIEQLDALAAVRGCNRSELLRDLTRAEVRRTALDDKVPAFAAVTLVYNHHVRELSERLTMLQHDLGEAVRSSMHVHLDHEHCLEVIVMRGRSDELKAVTGRMIGTRGVIQGGAEYVAEDTLSRSNTGRRMHQHDGHEPHSHPHSHAHAHPSAKTPPLKLRAKKTPARLARPSKARG